MKKNARRVGNTLRPIVLKPGDSFSCECGKVHPLGVYVAAHWTEELTHTCDCGRKRTVCNGVVELIENAGGQRPPASGGTSAPPCSAGGAA